MLQSGSSSGRGCRRSSPGRSRCRHAVARSRGRGSATWARTSAITRRRLGRRSRELGGRHVQRVRDELDRQHADDAPSASTTGAYGLAASRSTARRAACRRARRSARPASAARRHALAGRPRSTASRAAAASSTSSGRSRSASASSRAPRRRLAGAHGGAFHRSMSRTRCSASRLSARSAPTKSSTNSSAGLISSSAGGAYWASLPPSCMTAMRSPILIASSMSWVTKTIVLRSSRLQAQELVLQALAVDRVDRAERLVHQHQRRVGGERAGDADALALAAGQLRRVAVAPSPRSSADELEQLVDARADALLVPAEQLRDGGDVVGDRLVREQADLLDHVADLAPQLGRRRGRGRSRPPSRMSPLGDVDHAVDHPHRGRLAAARRADEHADLARRDLEREVVDGRRRRRPDSAWSPRGTRATRPPGGRRPLGLGGVRCHRRRASGTEERRTLAVHDARPPAAAAGVRGVLERVVERRELAGSRPSAVAVSQSANQAFLGSSGPCR